MINPSLALAVLLALAAPSPKRKPLPCHIESLKTPNSMSDMRDYRYCEILLMHAVGQQAKACVYNTTSLNHCPPAKWEAIDPKNLIREYRIDEVIMNGPRAWVMDEVTIDTKGTPLSIDGLEMKPIATAELPPGAWYASHTQRPYTETTITRNTIYTYAANRPVYKLVDANVSPARTYIMQSYSRTVDPTLTIGQLDKLANKLTLPCGWSYVVETPKHETVVKSDGAATITQDSLQNTYQRIK
ncbi:MAG TPA: hypothetical protein VJZ76_07635 [Thermoanaerobaculia bacterium]|nr:hypothetical protein [Thermoanaerobaculia bacterium]